LRLQRAVLASGGSGELFVDTLKSKRVRTVPLVAGLVPIVERWAEGKAASVWLGSGADPKVVQRILGHASAAMTMDLYGHLIDQNLWDAAKRLGGTTGAPNKLDAKMTKPPGEGSGL